MRLKNKEIIEARTANSTFPKGGFSASQTVLW